MSAIPRSYLFVPGNRPERFARAAACGADAVIVDLEDAVPPADKDHARTQVAAALDPSMPVVVRINAEDTAWFESDLALCRHAGVAAIMLPKAESIEGLERVAHVGLPVLPLIETACGMAAVAALAQVKGVARLAFGSIDFQFDLGIVGDDQELLYFRSMLVQASRVAGLAPPIDGVTVALDDEAQLIADTVRARRLGFGAKLCIHPRQIAQVNAGFKPTADEVTWATRVLAAASQANGAAVALDGKMVDRPVILKAQRIVDEAAL
ncbi:CoA ester lyase [Massilia aurea]|uniref:HpcH/HpaI aldolase/citrate lyase family protein n=1 Tax=Massilia aurea TaxID=373040 RepID=UPI0034635BB7